MSKSTAIQGNSRTTFELWWYGNHSRLLEYSELNEMYMELRNCDCPALLMSTVEFIKEVQR